MKKYFKIVVAALVVLVFCGTFVFLYMKSKPQPAVYDEFAPKVTDISKTTVITGTIEPRDEVEVKPQISGIITEIYKEAGETVKAGEVIAKVKVIPDMSQLSSAESRVRLADVNLKQAEVNHRREKQLYDRQLVSAEEYDNVRQALDQAREEKAAAVDALEVVRDGVSSSNASASSTLIRSTISGLILDIPVKVGNSVILSNTFNDGTTIATVADMSDLIFRGNVDETEVGRIHEGIPVKITLGALQNMQFNAVLEYISPKSIENNGANQFEIKAAIAVPDSVTIRSGYSANAEMELQHADGALTIPESAVEFSGDSTFVYVLTDSVPVQKFERRQVVTGISNGIDTEVKQGLKAGEAVRGLKIEK